MNTEWQLTKNRTRFVIGVVFLVAGFIWMAFFGAYMLSAFRYSTPDLLTVWLDIVIFGVFVFCFAYFVSTEKFWKMILGFCYALVVITGMFIIPIPQDYAEAVLGGYFILSMTPFFLYAKYKKSRKASEKQRHPEINRETKEY